jgi:hypothetical protein
MHRQLVHREELGKLIAQASCTITMIDDSHYGVRLKSGFDTYNVAAAKS